MKRALLQFIISLAVAFSSTFAVAAVTRIIETDWTWNSYYARSSASSSTHTVTGVGLAYAVTAIGADVSYSISFTTKTYDPSLGYSPAISTTVVHMVPSGFTVAEDFNAGPVVDPRIVIHGLNTSATVEVRLSYGEQRINP